MYILSIQLYDITRISLLYSPLRSPCMLCLCTSYLVCRCRYTFTRKQTTPGLMPTRHACCTTWTELLLAQIFFCICTRSYRNLHSHPKSLCAELSRPPCSRGRRKRQASRRACIVAFFHRWQLSSFWSYTFSFHIWAGYFVNNHLKWEDCASARS